MGVGDRRVLKEIVERVNMDSRKGGWRTAAKLKWPLLSRSVCLCVGDPVSEKKVMPALMASPRPHTP